MSSMELAAWMWRQAEDKGLLAACMEADADPDESVGRDEIFAILESP